MDRVELLKHYLNPYLFGTDSAPQYVDFSR